MYGKTFKLPSKEEMLLRLLEVDNNSHVQERPYPLLTKHGGEQKVAMGVFIMINLAILDYTQGMPPMIASMLYMRVDDYIDALCPDAEIAEEVKDFFKQALAATK